MGFLIGTIDYNYHQNPKAVEIWQPAKFEIPIYGLLIIIFLLPFVNIYLLVLIILKIFLLKIFFIIFSSNEYLL